MANPMVTFEGHLKNFKKRLADVAKHSDFSAKGLKDFATVTSLVNKHLKNATNTLAKMKKVDEDAAKSTLKLVASMEKLHDAAIKENAIREKRINSQRKAMNQSEAVRKNLLLRTNALKKTKDHEAALREDVKRSEMANVKYAKILKRVNRSLFSVGKSSLSASAGVHHLRNASEGGGMALSVLRSKLLIVAFGFNLLQRSIGNLVKAYGAQEAAEMKVRATLLSTKMAAGITFEEIKKLTQELQRSGVVGDETNLQMASLMLTYDKIGRKTFPVAMKAANDMATSLAMGIPTAEELKSTITMLSKALQEPERGMAALRKVGFSLNAEDEKRVKTLVHLKDMEGAHNVILKAANKQYGDMAKTIASSTLGQLNAMNMAMGDMSEEIGKSLAPLMLGFANSLKFVAERLDPSAVKGFTTALVLLGGALGVGRLNAMLIARAFEVKAAAAAGAAITTNQLASATTRLTLAMKLNPWIRAIGAILTLTPALIGLAGGFKKAKDEAQGFADAQLKVLESLRGTSADELISGMAEYMDLLKGVRADQDQLNQLMVAYGQESQKSMLPSRINEYREAFAELNPWLDLTKHSIDDMYAINYKWILEGLPQLLQGMEGEIKLREFLIKKIEDQKKAGEDEHVKKIRKSYADKTAILKLQTDAYDRFGAKVFGLTRAEELELETKTNLQKVASSLNLTTEQLTDTYPELASEMAALTEEQIKHNEALEAGKQMSQLMGEIKSEAFNLMTQMADAEIAKQNEVMQNDINNVKQSSAYKRAQKRGDNDAMAKLEKDAAKKTLPARRKAMKNKKHMANASIIMDAAKGVVKAYGSYDPVTASIVSVLIAAVAGLQMAQVNAQPLPSYARGGMVGGRRHSQGGTMIEAEQGEFVMSRSAVNSVGMENLNRMNQGGGGGGSVTVNVSGNILTQDFVEGELAENIKEAIRRGTDFGIS